MTFPTAVATVLRKYAVFSGRARRSEYWWFFLFSLLVSVVATVIDGAVFGTDFEDNGPLGIITAVALLLPTISVSVRRLHDVDRSGWFLLVGLIPLVGWIVLVVVTVGDSGPENRHGPSPKNPTGSRDAEEALRRT